MSARAAIKSLFPNLREVTSFKVTSVQTPQYNCIAWAADDQSNWWWPMDGKFWPEGAPRELTVDAFLAAFATRGYVRCEDGSLEEGFEKVALYARSSGEPT